MNNFKLSPPWETYRKKLKAIFELDESVTVGDLEPITGSEEGRYRITINVNNHAKAAALDKILFKSVTFGNITTEIAVTDTAGDETLAETLKIAFAGNERFWRVITGTDHTETKHTFVICDPGVIQFFNDDIFDYMGNFNALTADVARDIFDVNAHFNTADLREN